MVKILFELLQFVYGIHVMIKMNEIQKRECAQVNK